MKFCNKKTETNANSVVNFYNNYDEEGRLMRRSRMPEYLITMKYIEKYLSQDAKIIEIGAFVEFLPGREGLVHISKLDHKRVEKVTDVVNEGDEIVVKLTEIDKQGRMNLSRKDALPKPEKTEEE